MGKKLTEIQILKKKLKEAEAKCLELNKENEALAQAYLESEHAAGCIQTDLENIIAGLKKRINDQS